jgi:hypothetical protein
MTHQHTRPSGAMLSNIDNDPGSHALRVLNSFQAESMRSDSRAGARAILLT